MERKIETVQDGKRETVRDEERQRDTETVGDGERHRNSGRRKERQQETQADKQIDRNRLKEINKCCIKYPERYLTVFINQKKKDKIFKPLCDILNILNDAHIPRVICTWMRIDADMMHTYNQANTYGIELLQIFYP